MTTVETKTSQATPPTDIHRHALGNLQYIRSTMESAGAFTSVPGRSGISMGIVALIAGAIANTTTFQAYWLNVWLTAALVAIAFGSLFLAQRLRSEQQHLLHGTARRFFWSLLPPILAGAAITLGLFLRQHLELIPSVWLLSYGAGVLATASFSIRPVAVMGICFMILGLITLFVPFTWTNGLLTLGFGGLHLVFGLHIARFHGG